MCLRCVSPGEGAVEAPDTTFAVERTKDALRLAGVFETHEAPAIWRDLHLCTEPLRDVTLAIDLSDARAIDGAVMALLVALRTELASRGVRTEVRGTPEPLRPLVELYGLEAPPRRQKKRSAESAVAQLGRATIALGEAFASVVSFLGALLLAATSLVRDPRSGQLKEVASLVERGGADAVPFVAFINFLVGIVMANQAASQASGPLAVFGAKFFLADIVGATMTRELTPLITAIIVCGWSGAAFTAEIGAMKIAGELDALRTFGLRPFAWLAVPRVLSLLILTPALTVMGDVVGVLGGLAYSVTTQGLTVTGYVIETEKAVRFTDVVHGLIKSVVFALTIGLISCQQGFAASGGAAGVGMRTTSSVVRSFFGIVVLDTILTLVFGAIGL